MNYGKLALCVVLNLVGVATMYGADEGDLRNGKWLSPLARARRAQREETRIIKHHLRACYNAHCEHVLGRDHAQGVFKEANEHVEHTFKNLTNKQKRRILRSQYEMDREAEQRSQQEGKQDSQRIIKYVEMANWSEVSG